MEIINKGIDGGQGFDWGRTSKDYAKFRDIYPEEFYQKILEMGLCTKGQRVLDLGTGTGVLPRNLYQYGAEFIGVDVSENQIMQARSLSAQEGMQINYIVSSAEALTFPDKYFDAVTACQCYDYFDKTVLFPKVHSFLREKGYFCILFMSWLVEESEIAASSEKLILQYNPAWTGHSMKRFAYEFPREAEGLFTAANSFTYDIPVSFTRESWHGRMKACRGIGASALPQEEISKWEKAHWEYLKHVPESFIIPHHVAVLNLQKSN